MICLFYMQVKNLQHLRLHAMLLLELSSKGNVLLLGLGQTHSLLSLPRVPLSLTLEVQHARPACVDISNCALLVQSINLLELFVSEGLVDIVADVLGSGRKVLLNTHSDFNSLKKCIQAV